jgi:hypothetical protein
MDVQGRIGRSGEDVVDVLQVGRRARLEVLIRRQHGVVTHAQLVEEGVRRGAIEHRKASGRLTVIHRGVYLVGPLAAEGAPEMAAVLACGPDAYLSHDSAAQLRKLLPLPDSPGPAHVTVAGRNPRRRRDIHIHRAITLEPDETTVLDGIPITTVARTILDLAATLDNPELEHLVAEAYAANLTSRHQLHSLIARHPNRPGAPALRALLAVTPARTRSKPERMLLALLRRARLPEPRANTRLRGYEVDLVWPQHRLVVEFDGHAFHANRPNRHRARSARADQPERDRPVGPQQGA